MKIMVIQGPNINMLGKRDRRIYGSMTMSDIHEQMKAVADQAGVGIEFFQSNFEGEIVDKIQECLGEFDGIIINPAAYTHTSIAIRDALAAVNLPTIEVHISNIYQREEFRHKSLVAPVSTGHIAGFGPIGYHLAIIGMLQIFEQLKRIESASQNA
ncbi:MAG: type II 3-dehydroquinate dehydratase [Campylobacter lanienae]|uniref:type II 3-dehydroquinate dehydratase n=1 Tax=Campylobacter lanienae TaxID=75658 RepID=UPI0024309BC7|nr:type II 3-dehydroquinate dehydratase [Campylobacter lanienae]MCI5540243.1 type II 3-dehydroquinate dehydratase [Campylobacter lanienae]MDD7514193.1 type II 3-dehydroquinate dehydratase [Campylobacter lanienae]MDY3133555.1 type II 3-dehydroquinate dehydratase [Campylobacter lanienae]MDY5520150.1 type II 3-dehydroquinate dehydratase [Campylobacter lanienae]MDY6056888.1 type II 3-dehydroquinate dehydratase [Campylobacter lanienae]